MFSGQLQVSLSSHRNITKSKSFKVLYEKKNYFLIFIHSGNQVKIIPKMEKCKSKITFPYRQGIEKKNQFW